MFQTFCSDLVPPLDSFEIEDPTYGQLSEAMSETIDSWEAVTPPEEAKAWYEATLIAMQSFKTVLDAKPKGDPVDSEDETVGAAGFALLESSSAAEGLLSRDVRNSLVASGCFGEDATPDNHGDDRSTATTIAVGDEVEGALNYLGDIDYFKFRAEAGTSYKVRLSSAFLFWGQLTEDDSLEPTRIVLYDSSGAELESADLSETRLLSWEAPSAGDYYVSIGDWELGSYTLEVSIGADHGDDFENATAISLGEGVRGSLDSQDDKDVFVFHAEAGRGYEVDLSDYSFGSGRTKTGTLITVYDSAGQELAGTNDLFTELVWQAGATGNHYVVLGDGASQGSYTLTVKGSSDGGSPDDHGNDIDSATTITVGQAAGGVLEYDGDEDYFRFTAQEGVLYQIDVALGTLEDSYLSLRDADGRWLKSNNDFGNSQASRIVWAAQESGDYYLIVSSPPGWKRETGSYTLTVTHSDIMDDHGDDTENATTTSLGETKEGVIDYEGDEDYFRFTADAGQLYQVDVALGTLDDSEIVLLNSDGRELESNDDHGDSPASQVVWAAPDSGDYFVAVTATWGSGTGTGSYTLTVSLSDITDDHTDDINGATAISDGQTIEGVIDYEGDEDYFRFTVEAGQIYQIDVELGTLEDSYLGLLNSDGDQFKSNNDHGESKASRITWLAKESGDYYLRVVSPNREGGTGSYTLTVALGNPTDVVVGEAIEGPINFEGDEDYFRFQAKAGQLYMLDVTLGTLSDSSMTLYDASGTRLEDNDDYEDSKASRIFWEAPAAGDYYIEVEGDSWGEAYTYTLTVTEYVDEAAWRGNTDYDTDDDGFIEVSNLAQLNAMRWDLDGSGLPEHPPNNPLYAEAFPNAADRMGCPREECLGYELTADLDFDTNGNGSADSGDDYWNDGSGWDPIGWNAFNGAFTGFFEGRGHTISNLYINRSDTDEVGLFGKVRFSGLNRWALRGDIRHVGLIDVQVTGRSEVGGLVGANGVTVAACYVTGTVTGDSEVGGLVGSNFAGTVVASYAAASVTGNYEVGGLVGQNFAGDILASYAVSNVTGDSEVGGLVGGNAFGSGTATDSYWDVDTSGQSDSAGGDGKTTGEMQSPTDYMGIYQNWNVDLGDDTSADGPWDFGTASQYPTLRPPIP